MLGTKYLIVIRVGGAFPFGRSFGCLEKRYVVRYMQFTHHHHLLDLHMELELIGFEDCKQPYVPFGEDKCTLNDLIVCAQ